MGLEGDRKQIAQLAVDVGDVALRVRERPDLHVSFSFQDRR
jgi:hypothetical protein